ncbi:hypothetical protein FSP39_019506 [Pinctada imbricata]|uniref:ShKT domain-containing protein n=1 Tax=Pinctada imbricata TaxID=66713 RepID=A0AA88YU58_PINIB|nr:hypothetical protein FSP39_019506 [Pinctada imbricata]
MQKQKRRVQHETERDTRHVNIKHKRLHINRRDHLATGADFGWPFVTQVANGVVILDNMRKVCNAEINPNFNVFTMSTSPTSKPIYGTCDDSSYEACQYFIHSKNDSCQDVNMQRICPKSCGICVGNNNSRQDVNMQRICPISCGISLRMSTSRESVIYHASDKNVGI